jgi:hypothetical protein
LDLSKSVRTNVCVTGAGAFQLTTQSRVVLNTSFAPLERDFAMAFTFVINDGSLRSILTKLDPLSNVGCLKEISILSLPLHAFSLVCVFL